MEVEPSNILRGPGLFAAAASRWSQAVAGSWLAVFLGVFVVVLVVQLMHGTYIAAFDGSPDEGAHVVTSLLYRQFLLHPTASPLAFAKHFYSHYPSVAAGHWPPGLHLPAAVWMLIVGTGRVQLVVYLALISTMTATLLYFLVRSIGSSVLAGMFCCVWLLLGQTQWALTRFMTEGQSALLVTASAAAYVWYLREPRHARAVLFGVLAAAAILTRETAIALAFVPPLTVLMLGRWDLLRRSHFWLPAVVVVALVAPWHYLIGSLGVGRYGGGALERVFEVIRESTVSQRLYMFVVIAGWPLTLMSAWGIGAVARATIRTGENAKTWAVFGSLLAGGILFHLLVPESEEPRHLYQLTPTLVLFAAAGAWQLCAGIRKEIRPIAAAAVGLCCVVGSIRNFSPAPKADGESLALVAIAEELVRSSAQRILIMGSRAKPAGSLIAEFALREPIPGRHLIRDSKTLYQANWNDNFYKPRISEDDEMWSFLNESGLERVVRFPGEPDSERLHEQVLMRQIQSEHSPWRRADLPSVEPFELYETTAVETMPTRSIRLHTETRWGTEYEIKPGHRH